MEIHGGAGNSAWNRLSAGSARTKVKMPMKCLTVVIAGALIPLAAFAQQPDMKPFVMDWQNNTASSADVSFLLDAPAGRTGFIGVRDGHLAYPDGRRFRIWGFNITGNANFP